MPVDTQTDRHTCKQTRKSITVLSTPTTGKLTENNQKPAFQFIKHTRLRFDNIKI